MSDELVQAEIDDDHFEYDCERSEGNFPISQCISGFGRNASEQIRMALNDAAVAGFDDASQSKDVARIIDWHINELVRWCRYHNGKCQRLAAEVERLRGAAQNAIDHYDMRAEIYTNDDDLAFHMAAILRTGVSAKEE